MSTQTQIKYPEPSYSLETLLNDVRQMSELLQRTNFDLLLTVLYRIALV